MGNNQRWVYGTHSVLELLRASPADVSEIFLLTDAGGAGVKAVIDAARQAGVPVRRVHSQWMMQMARGEKHQGVIAQVCGYRTLQAAELLTQLPSGAEQEWVLILDGLTDPRNFGALLRTAEAAGVQHVVIPKDRSVGITPTVVKASAGALHHLKIFQVTNLRRAIVALKERGFWMVGLDVQSPVSIYEQEFPDKLGISLGSEGKGMRPLVLRECDFRVAVPMAGKIASLNVAVAGAVLLYELVRQKRFRATTQH
jgi:23S rRNA (guanosine2251-2'-O)-methyltransferase